MSCNIRPRRVDGQVHTRMAETVLFLSLPLDSRQDKHLRSVLQELQNATVDKIPKKEKKKLSRVSMRKNFLGKPQPESSGLKAVQYTP